MRTPALALLLTGAILLVACDSTTKPSDSNFKKAIDEYLTKHAR